MNETIWNSSLIGGSTQGPIHPICISMSTFSKLDKKNDMRVNIPARQVSKYPQDRALAGLWSGLFYVCPQQIPKTVKTPSQATNLAEGN